MNNIIFNLINKNINNFKFNSLLSSSYYFLIKLYNNNNNNNNKNIYILDPYNYKKKLNILYNYLTNSLIIITDYNILIKQLCYINNISFISNLNLINKLKYNYNKFIIIMYNNIYTKYNYNLYLKILNYNIINSIINNIFNKLLFNFNNSISFFIFFLKQLLILKLKLKVKNLIITKLNSFNYFNYIINNKKKLIIIKYYISNINIINKYYFKLKLILICKLLIKNKLLIYNNIINIINFYREQFILVSYKIYLIIKYYNLLCNIYFNNICLLIYYKGCKYQAQNIINNTIFYYYKLYNINLINSKHFKYNITIKNYIINTNIIFYKLSMY